ncbi:MAG: FecR domain-containing protein [Acidobacteriota bacterium]
MKPTKKELNNIFDKVTREIHNQAADPNVIKQAAERVWTNLAHEAETDNISAPVTDINSCADFQSLIPAYLNQELSPARVILLEDHTRECLNCRKTLKQARTGKPSQLPAQQKQTSDFPYARTLKWAVAAVFVICFGLAIPTLMRYFNRPAQFVHITVQSANGGVYRVAETANQPIAAGAQLEKGEHIRTAKDAGAIVTLTDGSRVEVKERSEFYVTENTEGTTIHLEQGNIIVEAAKQHSRHLYVATADCLVSVTGTIFSVNSGTKGSRVSVIEGEVHVDHDGKQDVLKPGDQVSTHPNLVKVPIKNEIAWSRDAERYVNLLTEISKLNKKLNEQVQQPGLRYSTRLLNLMPEETVLYAALPNLSATLTQSYQILQEQLQQNAALRQWWQQQNSAKDRLGMDELFEKIREFGQYLGEEIVASVKTDNTGKPESFLVLAELRDPAGLRIAIENQIAALAKEQGQNIIIIDDPFSASLPTNQHDQVYIWINGDLLAATPQLKQLQQLATTLSTPNTNGFISTPFYQRIAELYREGAGLIVAADLQQIFTHLLHTGTSPTTIEQLGINDLKHFIFEQKMSTGKTHHRAVLTFNGTRRGITSWLAAPGPMAGLEFVSPDANVAAAFVVKEPVSLVDDLFTILTNNPALARHLKDLETKHGIDIRNDIAAPLGGEFIFAIDGPLLPTPSWKLIFEVYDPVRLQAGFERVVEEVNRELAANGKPGFQWEHVDIGGRTFYTVKSPLPGLEIHYTFVSSYLIAAPSRALLDRAIRYRESGYTLLRAPRFIAALPEDSNANFSALLYHDLASLMTPIAEQLANSANIPEDRRQSLKSLAANTPPTLAYAYAQGDRIIFAANSEGGPLGLSAGTLLGLPNSFGLQNILEKALREQPPQR